MTIEQLRLLVDVRQDNYKTLRAMAWLGFPVAVAQAEHDMWQAIRWLRRADN